MKKENRKKAATFWGLWGSITFFGGLFILLTNIGVTSAMIFGGLATLMGFGLLYMASYIYRQRIKRTCRSCGKEGAMAITYGDEEGLCRGCLENVAKIPSVLKENSEEKT